MKCVFIVKNCLVIHKIYHTRLKISIVRLGVYTNAILFNLNTNSLTQSFEHHGIEHCTQGLNNIICHKHINLFFQVPLGVLLTNILNS